MWMIICLKNVGVLVVEIVEFVVLCLDGDQILMMCYQFFKDYEVNLKKQFNDFEEIFSYFKFKEWYY